MNWLREAWVYFFGWPAIATVVGCCALAIAILEPKQLDAITDLRKWAIGVAVLAFSFLPISGKYYHDGVAEGIAVEQSVWDKAVDAEVDAGDEARSDAVATVHDESPDSVRDDPRNRDARGPQPAARSKSPVRGLARHRFFGKS